MKPAALSPPELINCCCTVSYQLPLETAFQLAAIRQELRGATDMESVRSCALKAIDLMELQHSVVATLLRQNYLPADDAGG